MTTASFTALAERVVEHWNAHFADERPFFEQFEDWYGVDYPLAVDIRSQRASDQGLVSPDTNFAECLANARSYAAPHLRQLAQALDHEHAKTLRRHLTSTHEVIVVDVGCAAGILALLVDRAGFSHYIGIDTNNWMRLLARAVFETTLNDIAVQDGMATHPDFGVYGPFVERDQYSVTGTHARRTTVRTVRTGQPGFGILESIDSHDGWTKFVEKIAHNHDLQAPGARKITVLVVMNHLLFQLGDVPRTVTTVLGKCRALAQYPGVNPFLVSIEPGTLYKPDRFGTQGFDKIIVEQRLNVVRYGVPGLSTYLTGNSKGDAAVRLISF